MKRKEPDQIIDNVDYEKQFMTFADKNFNELILIGKRMIFWLI
jgi:hypothetical protein